jgi:Bacterial capsule synthesis protein PGA_cap
MRRAARFLCLLIAATPLAPVPGQASSHASAALPRSVLVSSTVTVGAVGDTIFGNTPVLPADPDGYLAAVAGPLAGPDITFANLEGTLTTATDSKCSPGSTACFTFRNPPRYAQYLKDDGVDIAGMGNNHSHDFGDRGLEQTVDALTNHGVRHTGLPGEIAVLRRDGLRVAFLAFAPYRWTASLLKLDRAAGLIRTAGERADLVVVYMHAGAEGSDRQHVTGREEYFLGEDRGNPKRFAHMSVNNGADLVIASGPHVLRGMEFYRHRLIAYSLGNFCGYKNFNTDGVMSRSAILKVTLRARGAYRSGRIVSLHLSSTNRPSPDPSGAAALMIRKLGHTDFGDRSPRIFADGHLEERG